MTRHQPLLWPTAWLLAFAPILATPRASAQLIPPGMETFASFGSLLPLDGTLVGTLSNDGQTAGPVAGQFRDLSNPFAATSNPAYQGSISASFSYVEPVNNLASVSVYGSYASIRVASGSGTFTSPTDWTLNMSFDFSGLTDGALPSGSFFGLVDLDGNTINGPVASQLTSVRAYDAANNLISVPWLTDFAYQDAGTLDPSSGQPDPTYPADYATHTVSGGSYAFTSATVGTDTTLITARTTDAISRIEISYFGAALENTQFLFGGPFPVPEPSGALLVSLAGLTAWLRRCRA